MAERPRQEVRLAVVLTGGVSLAVWMGGVAREINLLTQVSRAKREGVQGTGSTDAESRLRDADGELLALLGVDVSIDVLSGTSAGGINAAVLGLANARGLDIGTLRGLWDNSGALSTLLRNPREATVTQAAAVAVSAVQAVGTVPPPVRPVAKAASWTTQTAYMAASRSTDRRGFNAAACLAIIAGGLGLMASNQPALSTIGFGAALAGVFLLSLLARRGQPRKVVAALGAVLVLGVTAALAAAVWMQPVRDWLFPQLTRWLEDFHQGQQPWVWFAIVVFLLAPPVVMVVDAVFDVRRGMAARGVQA